MRRSLKWVNIQTLHLLLLVLRDCHLQLPQSPWPKDPKLKEIGRYHQLNVLEGLGPYTYALFTRVLGWSRAEIEVILASARNEVKDLSIHLYTRLWIVYGRKPEKSA